MSIMKRKFKPRWSSILPISTKRTFTSHLSLIEKRKRKKRATYDVGNPGPRLRQGQQCDGLN